MNKRLLITVVVLCLFLIAATSINSKIAHAESPWLSLTSGECYQYYHNLGYEPWDVHVWVSTADKTVNAVQYTDLEKNYVQIGNAPDYIQACYYGEGGITLKIVAH